ncbi:MAG TPA: hypothetical protein DHV62_02530 [Elusimicrobia bacterium]|jgi:deoxyribonuclease-4|nr:hypothetical protein [Elusimicrobiota bacterium]
MRIGVHCSIANGLLGVLDEAKSLNCQTIQFFSRSPRVWQRNKINTLEIKEFKERQKFLNIYPLTLHTPYLPNLCSSDDKLYQHSLKVFIEDLEYTGILGADYLTFHPGSYSEDSNSEEGCKRLIEALNSILAKVKNRVVLLIENTAGGGRKVGWNFSELGLIIKKIREKKRIGICFDTCHAYAAGYAISQKESLKKTLTEFDRYIGLEKLKLLHTNDSKKPLGSKIDRHEHLGKGYIGLAGFRLILNHPVFKKLPAILETPKDNSRSDKRNLTILRSLIS